jgi:DNA topoisomerase 2-associated protein PAT1
MPITLLQCPSHPLHVLLWLNACVLGAGSVAAAISSLDLAALSACLATALGAVEYPPLRPLRSVNGDGATVVLLAVLDRASVVLSGQEGGPPPSAMAQEIWQSNFDSFFGLLAKHCSAKFEAIAAAAEAGGGMNAAAAAAIGAEVRTHIWSSEQNFSLEACWKPQQD